MAASAEAGGIRMAGKVALITGGGSGIGAAVAQRFAAGGARVAVIGRRLEPLERVARATGGLAIQADVADYEACRAAVAKTVAEFGQLDIVVPNAGVEHYGSATQVSLDAWREMLNTNVDGVMFIARASLEHMTARGGSIVIMASLASILGAPNYAGYLTSKSALLGLTRSLAVDYGSRGVRVNAICPGFVRTEMTDRALQYVADKKGITLEAMVQRTTAHYPLRRMAEPDEIAAAIEFLASDQASFITGATLVVDGGGSIVDAATLVFSD